MSKYSCTDFLLILQICSLSKFGVTKYNKYVDKLLVRIVKLHSIFFFLLPFKLKYIIKVDLDTVLKLLSAFFVVKRYFSYWTFYFCADLELPLLSAAKKPPISWLLNSAPVPWCEAMHPSYSGASGMVTWHSVRRYKGLQVRIRVC